MSDQNCEYTHGRRPTASQAVTRGILGGAWGTAAMAVAMAAIGRLLPASQQQDPPQRQIVEDFVEAADLENAATPRAITAAAWLSHFGYGSALGAAYGVVSHRLRRAGPGAGVAFGLAAWCGSYPGWLPLFRMRATATAQSAERNLTLVAGHVVWGATVGWLCGDRGRSESSPSSESDPKGSRS